MHVELILSYFKNLFQNMIMGAQAFGNGCILLCREKVLPWLQKMIIQLVMTLFSLM